MNIPAKTEYACIAVLELATSYGSGQPVRIRTIADRHGIPSRFLVQILLQLKSAGIVSSTRGAAGGYRLIRDPGEISLHDVMSVVDGPPADFSLNSGRETAASSVLSEAWNEVVHVEREMLSRLTFAELLERSRGLAEHMYYI